MRMRSDTHRDFDLCVGSVDQNAAIFEYFESLIQLVAGSFNQVVLR